MRPAGYEGDDPLGYVVCASLPRRYLSEGQQATVVAMLAVRV